MGRQQQQQQRTSLTQFWPQLASLARYSRRRQETARGGYVIRSSPEYYYYYYYILNLGCDDDVVCRVMRVKWVHIKNTVTS